MYVGIILCVIGNLILWFCSWLKHRKFIKRLNEGYPGRKRDRAHRYEISAVAEAEIAEVEGCVIPTGASSEGSAGDAERQA